MGTKIKCPKCKRMGTLRLREKNSNTLIMSHYDSHLYKKSTKKGTRSCYIGSYRKNVREFFSKYPDFEINSVEYSDFAKQLGKIKKSLKEKNESKLPSQEVQETIITILHNLTKIRSLEQRKAEEVEKGFTWENIHCLKCGASHNIKVHAVKRRSTYRTRIFGKTSYYSWYMKRRLNK